MSKLKNIIILVVVLIILIFIYLTVFSKDEEEQVPLLDSSGSIIDPSTTGAVDPTGGVGADFLTILLNVQSITLDDSIFSEPAFATLHDSSITLTPDGTEGRPNPFAPIGIDVAPLPTTTITPTTPTATPAAKPATTKSTPVKPTTGTTPAN